MRNESITMRIAVAGLGLLLLGLAPLGCAKQEKAPPPPPPPPKVNNDAFLPEGEIHAVDRFTEAQSARGALADAMLYPRHFDGAELNTVGMTKLNLMLQKNPAGQPMVVYLNTGERDDHADARRAAVEGFVAASEYTATALDIRTGPNLGKSHPAAAGIAALPKTDTAERDGAARSSVRGGSGSAGSSVTESSSGGR